MKLLLLRTAGLVMILIIGTGALPATSVFEASPLQQMYILKQLDTDVQRVGILWNKGANETLMTQLQRAARSSGMSTFLTEVSTLVDIPSKFHKLTREHHIQALWIMQSGGVLNTPKAQEYLITHAAGEHMPLIAPTEQWVRKGASLTILKNDRGLQVLLNHTTAKSSGLVVPEKMRNDGSVQVEFL